MGAVHSHAVAGVVQQDLMEGINILLFLGGRAAQGGPHPAQKFHDAKGLGDVIICTAVQPAHGIQLAGFCCDHDDGQAAQSRGIAELFQDGETVLTGQHHIQNDQLRLCGAHGLPERLRGFKALHFVSAGLQCILLQLADGGIVFYNVDHLLGSSFAAAGAVSLSGKR